MQFIHIETHQGAIAAAHSESPTRQLYGQLDNSLAPQVISPVVIDQMGVVTFLRPVRSVDEAIAVAKRQIETDNRSYMNYVIKDRVAAANAVQHFEDCGIPLEMVPPLATDRPYFPPMLPESIQHLFQSAS